MKLYVWNSPYSIPFGGSIAYAIADSQDEARSMAEKSLVSQFGYMPMNGHPEFKLGVPDRVCDLPYAEIYEWSE